MERAKTANPFETRLRQGSADGMPSEDRWRPQPQAAPQQQGSHPFARMGGMGARAALSSQGRQPPPQAPAYGLRARQRAEMPGMRERGSSPPPTGMPGGVMGERGSMERLRGYGRQLQDMDPLRQRLMAAREMAPPPPRHANPFFSRMYEQGPPPAQFDLDMNQFQRRMPYGGPTPYATPGYYGR